MSNISDFFKKKLENYDNNVKENMDYIKNIASYSNINLKLNRIIINKTEFDYEYLGSFELKSKVWLWSWSMPSYESKDIEIARNLLMYGMEIQTDDLDENGPMFFLKTLLINSRHYIKNSFSLDILLAISLSLIKSRCKFIYPYEIKNGSIIFLLIK